MNKEKHIIKRYFIVLAAFFAVAVLIVYKLFTIQFVEGDKYEDLAQSTVYRTFTIEPNRGNVYDSKMNLLATSVTKYEIRFDPVSVSDANFKKYLEPLADGLAEIFPRSSNHYQVKFKKARQLNNRYVFIAKNLDYSAYLKVKGLPMFNLGAYKGGFIAEQSTVREYPLGKVGKRTVGYNNVGLEGAFEDYLQGEKGQRLKQKIAKGQWKPITDINQIEPVDGLDVVTTIDVNIQDITHHALLKQLEAFEADHGTAIVMETKTGEIKAIANLGMSKEFGKYYEKRNYAVYETHEPGSTFKLMSLVAALEDKVVDTSTVINTEKGRIEYFDRVVTDSRYGGYGKISVARALELSSNTAFAKMIYNNYKDKPEQFSNRLKMMGLDEKIGLQIKGEGHPHIPHPDDANWYGTTLPWMSFGYGVSLTALQTLTFYNAIANDGMLVKPKFIKSVRDRNRIIESYEKPIISGSVCSEETAKQAKSILQNAVERGTAEGIYSEDFSMAGKTGTCQTEYWKGSGKYISSFAGYFPADEPKYSCIVVIHKPNPRIGYYGSKVAAPVFKSIAKKIYSDTPLVDEIEKVQFASLKEEESSDNYNEIARKYKTIMPNLVGMPAMDAISILENNGLNVKLIGEGKVVKQSISAGTKIKSQTQINLILG
ncbi:MAG: penicillin-binding protein [Psychroflexus sp.]|uniref:penicillin-binding protein n=1 Tax=Psychroflexus sp. S27 TaxID=1982757 RepID=UPI000C2B128F|nr:penicillin-binding protein [Psychroflexus sp. S27]PJX23934.1 penicillin-binding protein [Psychroflexus sp. S27]